MSSLCLPFSFPSKRSFSLSNKDTTISNNNVIRLIKEDDLFLQSEVQEPQKKNSTHRETEKTENTLRHTNTNPTESGDSEIIKRETKEELIISSTLGEIEPDEPSESARRPGIIVSKEADYADGNYKKYDKNDESITLIKKALKTNEFLSIVMNEERINYVTEAMYPQNYEAGSFLIKQGEKGSHLFISAEGDFEIIQNGKLLNSFGPGVVFGELAILYRAMRFASIRAINNAKVWVLDQRDFKKITKNTREQEQANKLKFLSSVYLLKDVHQLELLKLSEFLKRKFFVSGQDIVRQGEKGDQFFIICGGTATITRRSRNGGPNNFIKNISRGDYFGEKALLEDIYRKATVTANDRGVDCLVLDRKPFCEYLGNIEELKKKYPISQVIVSEAPAIISNEFKHLQLNELTDLGSLGKGAFGRVKLLQYTTKDTTKLFALKYIRKVDVVEQRNMEYIFNEKSVMQCCNSNFVCKLYNTYKDEKYIYFLMEPILGGDVWTILNSKKYLDEKTSRFMAACVVEALGHLHSHGIIYRDLKPENLMLDTDGYVKLVDFGCSKFLSAGSKTDTFVGTTEYLAPELVKDDGHDRAVDYWALGILIHELLVGKPPFRGQNRNRTYQLILNGIEVVKFDPRISKVTEHLIKKLCRDAPVERLGYAKNGISDIKNHKWFSRFNWDKLKAKKLRAPLIPVKRKTLKQTKDDIPPDELSGWDNDF